MIWGAHPYFWIFQKKHPAHRLTSPQKPMDLSPTTPPPLRRRYSQSAEGFPRRTTGTTRCFLWQDVEIPLGKMDETKIWWCLCRFCVFCASEAFLLLFFCEFFQLCFHWISLVLFPKLSFPKSDSFVCTLHMKIEFTSGIQTKINLKVSIPSSPISCLKILQIYISHKKIIPARSMSTIKTQRTSISCPTSL